MARPKCDTPIVSIDVIALVYYVHTDLTRQERG
jgi:hypothetical protein